jgi:type II secretory ATPase GspE/PulE/Tfp pilus assembly ATPase PilB-like protein
LCDRCKSPAQLSETHLKEFQKKGLDHTSVYRAVGCKNCEQTGYFGRTAFGDILVVTEELKTNIAGNKALIESLKKEEGKKSMSNLKKQGLKKVLAGITSLEELKRVTG